MLLSFFQSMWMGIWEGRWLGPVAPRTKMGQIPGRWRPGLELATGVLHFLQDCPSAQPMEEGGRELGDVPATARCPGWLS